MSRNQQQRGGGDGCESSHSDWFRGTTDGRIDGAPFPPLGPPQNTNCALSTLSAGLTGVLPAWGTNATFYSGGMVGGAAAKKKQATAAAARTNKKKKVASGKAKKGAEAKKAGKKKL